MTMVTIFEQIPDPFIQAYDAQFQTWAREFRTRGNRCAVIFDKPPGAPVVLDMEARPVQHGAWLKAHLEAGPNNEKRVVIEPENEFAAELIARHTKEMMRYWFS